MLGNQNCSHVSSVRFIKPWSNGDDCWGLLERALSFDHQLSRAVIDNHAVWACSNSSWLLMIVFLSAVSPQNRLAHTFPRSASVTGSRWNAREMLKLFSVHFEKWLLCRSKLLCLKRLLKLQKYQDGVTNNFNMLLKNTKFALACGILLERITTAEKQQERPSESCR